MVNDDEIEKSLVEASIEFHGLVDAKDIVRALGDNDELALTFICEMLAVAGSEELRQNLQARLADWHDEEYI